MDNEIRIVTDKETYLVTAPLLSQSDSETALRKWLGAEGFSRPEHQSAIRLTGMSDLQLPMSVTSIESSGKWSLVQGVFQKREFDRDQRQYERDLLSYQTEEKRQKSGGNANGQVTLPPVPKAPDREQYFEYFPDSGDYDVAFKGILRAFGAEALGAAQDQLHDVAIALDQLLRHGFPAAAPAAKAPAPINHDVLNTLAEEAVSDKGIDWVKEKAKTYDRARKLAISDVSYKRECNIVFLPVRLIAYEVAGQRHVALADPIRNEYVLGAAPAVPAAAIPTAATPAATPAAKPAAAPAAKSGNGLVIMAGAAVALLAVAGGVYWKISSGPHNAGVPAAAQHPAASAPAAAPAPVAATAPAPSTPAASAAAPSTPAPVTPPAPAPETAATTPAQTAPVTPPPPAAPPPAVTLAVPEPVAQAPAFSLPAPPPAPPPPIPAPAPVAHVTIRPPERVAIERPAPPPPVIVPVAPPAPPPVVVQPVVVQPAPPPAVLPPVAQPNNTAAFVPPAPPATKPAPAPKQAILLNAPPAAAPAPGDTFAAGAVRLTNQTDAIGYNGDVARTLSQESSTQDWRAVTKTVTHSNLGGDIGYYYLGQAAQKAGLTAAARTYYMLSISNSERNISSTQCTPGAARNYSPDLCRGITLPYSAERALSSLAPPPAPPPPAPVIRQTRRRILARPSSSPPPAPAPGGDVQ